MRRALLLATSLYGVAATLTPQELQQQIQGEQQEEFTVAVAGLNRDANTVLGLSTPVRT